MNLFANPPDLVLAIQDILKAVSVKAVKLTCIGQIFNDTEEISKAAFGASFSFFFCCF